jgi:hypothetical protein
MVGSSPGGSSTMPRARLSSTGRRSTTTGAFAAARSGPRISVQGRKFQFAASGSSRWPGRLVGGLINRHAQQVSRDMFRGSADIRPRTMPSSGVGARSHSLANSDCPRAVGSRHVARKALRFRR